MARADLKWMIGLSALALGATAGCGDADESSRDDTQQEDAGPGNTGGKDGGKGPDGDEPEADGGEDPAEPGSDGGTPEDAGPQGPSYAELPAALSLSGCAEFGIGPLCSVAQDEGSIQANCGGVVYTGSIDEAREVKLSAPGTTTQEGAKVNVSCTGKYQLDGTLTAKCTQTTSAVGDTPASEATCDLRSDRVMLPEVGCFDLPATLDDVVICKEGAAQGGTTIEAGTCKVIQDGCVFQAECANNLVLTGTVSADGISFNQTLKALADAQTPSGGGDPAFLKGAEVSHACTAVVEGTSLTGTCGAGRAGRGGVNTSECAVEGTTPETPSCALLSPTQEHLFVLDSCEILKEGEGSNPGIGEPVCAFRQNNCVWDVQCGNNPDTKFSGRLKPGATKVEWRLPTGTPCEVSFDASGNVTGKCTVPGQAPCMLKSKPAVPGGEDCPVIPVPENADFWGRGCGNGNGRALVCRSVVQHGCNFMAACDFSYLTMQLMAGAASYKDERGHLEFNGVNGYQCYVDQATADDVANDNRKETEWYGQCLGPTGGMCRDNYDPETGSGFRGLQIFFEPTPEE
jgi:hypothetical protein